MAMGADAFRAFALPRRSSRTRDMTRDTPYSSPLLLGFDAIEKTLERVAKNGDGYPPYNIERLRGVNGGSGSDSLRITLAVAGFDEADLEVTLEDSELVVRGR